MGGGFLALFQVINIVASIVTALKIPNQGLDQVHLLIDRHPELGRLIAKGIEEPIDADFRPVTSTEERKPKSLPFNTEDDTPDASDDTEEQDGEYEENK